MRAESSSRCRDNAHSSALTETAAARAHAIPALRVRIAGAANAAAAGQASPKESLTCWTFTCYAVTFWAPNWMLSKCGMRNPLVRMAWREKITLCLIIALLCGALAFITFFFTPLVCKTDGSRLVKDLVSNPVDDDGVPLAMIQGFIVALRDGHLGFRHTFPMRQAAGLDLTPLFQSAPSCADANIAADFIKCRVGNFPEKCHKSRASFDYLLKENGNLLGRAAYQWEDIGVENSRMAVYSGAVLNLDPYLKQPGQPFGPEVDEILRYQAAGRDISAHLKYVARTAPKTVACLVETLTIGFLEARTMGCFVSDVVLSVSLVVILSVVFIRFFLAIYFSWFISRKLGEFESKQSAAARNTRSFSLGPSISRFSSSNNLAQTAGPGAPAIGGPVMSRATSSSTIPIVGMTSSNSFGALSNAGGGAMSVRLDSTNSDRFYTIVLVTCYSEGYEGIRNTIVSLAETDHPDDEKLIFIICDGIIKGSGNDKSTPDIVLDLVELEQYDDLPVEPKSYIAIADGIKRHNVRND